ncbi:MAG: thioredoxin [Blastococcus sp.]
MIGDERTLINETTVVVRQELRDCPNCGKRNRVPAAAAGVPRCGACHTALPWLTSAGDADFQATVVESSLPVLLDLWAPWCGPCKMVAPGVERAGRELAGQLKAVKVNVDESPEIASRYAAQSIPMLLVLDHGRVLAQQVGALPPDALLRWVRDAVGHREV